jgi:hypothetical protein
MIEVGFSDWLVFALDRKLLRSWLIPLRVFRLATACVLLSDVAV